MVKFPSHDPGEGWSAKLEFTRNPIAWRCYISKNSEEEKELLRKELQQEHEFYHPLEDELTEKFYHPLEDELIEEPLCSELDEELQQEHELSEKMKNLRIV